MRAFNICSWSYILLVGVFRVVAGSHYPLQVLSGVMIGFYWSQTYFAYISPKLQTFFFDIVVEPTNRVKSRRFIQLF